jgi:hypothetical protein
MIILRVPFLPRAAGASTRFHVPTRGLTDIVAKRYDAGIRLGDQVANMIAVRIGSGFRGSRRRALNGSEDGT